MKFIEPSFGTGRFRLNRPFNQNMVVGSSVLPSPVERCDMRHDPS